MLNRDEMKAREIAILGEKKPHRYSLCVEDALLSLMKEAKTSYAIDVQEEIRKFLRHELPRLIEARKSARRAG